MLERAMPDLADPLAAGNARRLEGLIADATGDPPKTPAILLDAAGMIAPHDSRLARDTLLQAVWTAHRAGRFGVGMAEALRGPAPHPGRKVHQRLSATSCSMASRPWPAITTRPAPGSFAGPSAR